MNPQEAATQPQPSEPESSDAQVLQSAPLPEHIRPDVLNDSFPVGLVNNGSGLSVDGRIRVGRTEEKWRAYAVRPEAVDLGADGKPHTGSFLKLFSAPSVDAIGGEGENAVALCSLDPLHPSASVNGGQQYEFWAIDSDMEFKTSRPAEFRRRKMHIRLEDPFTAETFVSSFRAEPYDFLTLENGERFLGIEPTLTHDGRLMIFQGAPGAQAPNQIDHIMYSFNPTPCGLKNWTIPRPLHQMHLDARLRKRYALASASLRAADGTPYSDAQPVRGAYPWVDQDGRNVLFMSLIAADGARRSGAVFLGADTLHATYLMDSGINFSTKPEDLKLFYSSPMWAFERGRPESLSQPPVEGHFNHRYLTISRSHDVLPLIGSNTGDYTEVDLSELNDSDLIVHLPMTKTVGVGGSFVAGQTPDHARHHFSFQLLGGAQISDHNEHAGTGPHSVGAVALLPDQNSRIEGTLTAHAGTVGLGRAATGLTLQISVKGRAPGNLVSLPGRISLVSRGEGAACVELNFHGAPVSACWPAGSLSASGWSHLAFVVDGVSKELRLYLNGDFTGVTRGVPFSGDELPVQILPTGQTARLVLGGSGFSGRLDNFKIISRARTARALCLTSPGANCAQKSHGEQLSSRGAQFRMDAQVNGCDSPSAWPSEACTRAAHRVCASQNLTDMLTSNPSNLIPLAKALLNGRAPVSMGGVWLAAEERLQCLPVGAEVYAITMHELGASSEACLLCGSIASEACIEATHAFCRQNRFATGFGFEQTGRAWLACYGEGQAQVSEAPQSALKACRASAQKEGLLGASCVREAQSWCATTQRGNIGFPVKVAGPQATVVCMNEAVSVTGVFSAFEKMIHSLYQDALGRAADAEGLSWYLGQLKEGRSADDIRDELSRSAEASIRRFYQIHLGREPDEQGRQWWLQQHNNGLSLDEIEHRIASSEEAQQGTTPSSPPQAPAAGTANPPAAQPQQPPVSQLPSAPPVASQPQQPVTMPPPNSSPAPSAPQPSRDRVQASTLLRSGDTLQSQSGRFQFVFQSDGNACVYDSSTAQALWCTQTYGQGARVFAVQDDANLVVYREMNAAGAVWASGAKGQYPQATLIMQNDGNRVLYSGPNLSVPLWASGTGGR